jgi:hypothetical protein
MDNVAAVGHDDVPEAEPGEVRRDRGLAQHRQRATGEYDRRNGPRQQRQSAAMVT